MRVRKRRGGEELPIGNSKLLGEGVPQGVRWQFAEHSLVVFRRFPFFDAVNS